MKHLFSLLFIYFIGCQSDTTIDLINTERATPDVPNIPSYSMTGAGSGWQLLNGGIFGYVIEDGEPYNVTFHNSLSNNQSSMIHAHGMTPPNSKDGVAYLVAPPIPAGDSVDITYNLTADNRGTYWIHSHFGFQLGSGMAAPLIVKGNDPTYVLYEDLENAVEVVMMLQDVCPYVDDDNITCDPQAVLSKLHHDFDDESDGEVESCPGIEPADDTDVMFVDFLANGRNLSNPIYVQVEMNSTVRLRIINAGSMTNYLIVIPDGFNATLVTVDGHHIKPYKSNSFWIAVAQRLDILLYVQQTGVFPILAVTESVYDKKSKQTGMMLQVGTSATGSQLSATSDLVPGMMGDQMEQNLEAFYPLPTKNATRVINIDLTGDNGFMSINNRSYMLPPMVPYYPNPFPYYVNLGDRVIIKMVNRNPDSHAMHLHGHTFQVLEINGKNITGAKRDVVLVPGGCGTATIAFDAVNPGKWLFHCHFEFHMQAGMMTTIEYTNTTIPRQEGTTLSIEQNDSAGVSLLGKISGLCMLFALFVLYL